MDEIIENVFMRATEFMHQSGIRMDADHVGKPQVSIPEFSANLPDFSAKYQNFPQNQ